MRVANTFNRCDRCWGGRIQYGEPLKRYEMDGPNGIETVELCGRCRKALFDFVTAFYPPPSKLGNGFVDDSILHEHSKSRGVGWYHPIAKAKKGWFDPLEQRP